MNIDKYQELVHCHKIQQPQQIREGLKALLYVASQSSLSSASVKIYNLLCGVDALLCRYETISRETIFALDIIEDEKDCREYLTNLHSNAIKQNVYASEMVEE